MAMKLYHGTARALGVTIEKVGLNPEGPFSSSSIPTALMPKHRGKSTMSELGYVYFFEDLGMAKFFACGVVEKVGMGPLGQVFEIDGSEVKVELDPLFESSSWRHRGKIPPEKLKSTEIFNCKEGAGND